MNKLIAIVRLCRVEHWIKNALVLLPPFFLGERMPDSVWGSAVPAFLSFSFVASAVYILNDWRDRELDAAHPVKRTRPLASGAVSGGEAAAVAATLTVVGAALLWRAAALPLATLTLAIYALVNVAYSMRFKAVPIVDIFLLAAGFVLRIFFSGCYFGVAISSWMFLTIFSGALYMACGKRRNELKRLGAAGETRPVLKGYTSSFLDLHFHIFCALTIVFYCLWTINRTDQHAVGKFAMTIPVLVFLMVRYNLLIDSDECDGDPVPLLLHDRWMVLGAVAFFAMNAALLFFGGSLPRIVYF